MKVKTIALAIAGLLSTSNIYAAEPTNQELMEMLKKQQTQIEKLKTELNKTAEKVKETDDKIETSVAVIEENLSETTASKTSIGGYGELHYGNIEESKQIDFHRYVLFFGHEYTDSLRFFSEVELEHSIAGEGQNGEVELEQAYIEKDLTDKHTLKAGVFLVPVGIINETHEPPTFYGVERNPIEKNIIPGTWWEGGAGLNAKITDGLTADFAVHSGLSVPTSGSKSFLIRNGRQKVSEANAENLAYTTRIKYTAVPGLELAGSYQVQSDITQGEIGADAHLLTAHAIYNVGGFGIRALFATWDIKSDAAEAIGRDKQEGFYIEPSYRINEAFGLFARYNVWDNNAGNSIDTELKQTNIGINYWLDEDVVLKADYEDRTGAHDGSGFNLGVGYQF